MRYSTTGSNAWENSQPVQRSEGTNGSRRELALAHNGNLINALELHEELSERGVTFSSTSDSEIVAALLATHPAERIEDAIADVLPRLNGAFSIVVMTKDQVVAFRDPHGLRPLALGVLPAGADRAETGGESGGLSRGCLSRGRLSEGGLSEGGLSEGGLAKGGLSEGGLAKGGLSVHGQSATPRATASPASRARSTSSAPSCCATSSPARSSRSASRALRAVA